MFHNRKPWMKLVASLLVAIALILFTGAGSSSAHAARVLGHDRCACRGICGAIFWPVDPLRACARRDRMRCDVLLFAASAPR